jgi:hypothetical protein
MVDPRTQRLHTNELFVWCQIQNGRERLDSLVTRGKTPVLSIMKFPDNV